MHPRISVRGATSAITRRCVLRKGFLAPWSPEVKNIWLYSLAYAALQEHVAVHDTRLVITHHHTNATPEGYGLSEFLRLLHRDASCGINTLLAEHRYDPKPGPKSYGLDRLWI
jgi:hypothetical protein